MAQIDYSNPQTDTIELKRTLGKWQLLFYGLGSMLGAGIYALVGKAALMMGNAVWMAFAAAMVGAILTGLSYASLGSRHPRAGGAAYITQHAFGITILSYIIGIAVTMSGLTSMAAGTQAMADNLLKGFSLLANQPYQAGSIWIKPVSVVIVLMIGLVLIKGIRESMWANLICTFVEAAGLLFIIAVGMRFWGSVDYMEMPVGTDTGHFSTVLMLVLSGAVLTFFSFIGFEDILNVSEEVKNPSRDVPFGLVGAMILATLIYMGVAITAVSVIPYQEFADSGSTPLVRVAQVAAPWFGRIDVVYVGISIFAIGNTALLNYLMGSRLLYGMSRQGLLPGFLGIVNARTQTPVVAICVLFLIVTALIAVGNVKALAESTVLLLLCVFIIMNASLIRLKLKKDEPKGRFEVPLLVPILGLLVCGAMLVRRAIDPFLGKEITSEAYLPPMLAAVIIVAAAGLYFVVSPVKVAEEGKIKRD